MVSQNGCCCCSGCTGVREAGWPSRASSLRMLPPSRTLCHSSMTCAGRNPVAHATSTGSFQHACAVQARVQQNRVQPGSDCAHLAPSLRWFRGTARALEAAAGNKSRVHRLRRNPCARAFLHRHVETSTPVSRVPTASRRTCLSYCAASRRTEPSFLIHCAHPAAPNIVVTCAKTSARQ